MPHRKTKRIIMRIAGFFMGCLFFLLAGAFIKIETTHAADEPEILETHVGLDQMVKSKETNEAVSASENKTADQNDLSLDEQQLVDINKSLKNAIEENKKLMEDKKAIEDELKDLRGRTEVSAGRINFLNRERENLQRRLDEAENLQKNYTKQIEDLKKSVDEKANEFQKKLEDFEKQKEAEQKEQEKIMQALLPDLKGKLSAADAEKKSQDLKRQAYESLANLEKTTQKAAAALSRLNRENKKLKKDSTKLHYNLANILFEKGQYEKAAVEYKKIVELMPYDASAHYNLAFVSGEFLKDYQTALTHYKEYLNLYPNAEDTPLVNEKILEAELQLRAHIQSPIDKLPNEKISR